MLPVAKLALVLIAACAAFTGAMAQKVYKCGSSYSQIPCPDGVTVEADDARTKAQKSAATLNNKSQARQAEALEKERLKDEAQARATDQAWAKAQHKKEPPGSKPEAKKKNKEPEYFTAKPPAPAKK